MIYIFLFDIKETMKIYNILITAVIESAIKEMNFPLNWLIILNVEDIN